jgi:hypothetical protein
MGNPKIAIIAYCLAVGFILAVALHSPSKRSLPLTWWPHGPLR